MSGLFEADAWILDRDGTLVYPIAYLHEPDRVKLLPGVQKALYRAKQRGIRLFIYTNQSGIHRGYYGWREFDRTQQRLYELLGLGLGDFTEVCAAPESPDEPPLYRKPHGTKFIPEILTRYGLRAERCYMIGDSEVDVEVALHHGLQGVALGTGEPMLTSECECSVGNTTVRFYQDWQELLTRHPE